MWLRSVLIPFISSLLFIRHRRHISHKSNGMSNFQFSFIYWIANTRCPNVRWPLPMSDGQKSKENKRNKKCERNQTRKTKPQQKPSTVDIDMNETEPCRCSVWCDDHLSFYNVKLGRKCVLLPWPIWTTNGPENNTYFGHKTRTLITCSNNVFRMRWQFTVFASGTRHMANRESPMCATVPSARNWHQFSICVNGVCDLRNQKQTKQKGFNSCTHL